MKLSAKQHIALLLAAHGHTTQSGANEMNISEQMYCRHLQKAREKIKAINTSNAVYKACKSGLICFLIVAMQLAEVAVYFDNNLNIDFSRMTRRVKTKRDNEMAIIQHIPVQGRNIVLQS